MEQYNISFILYKAFLYGGNQHKKRKKKDREEIYIERYRTMMMYMFLIPGFEVMRRVHI